MNKQKKIVFVITKSNWGGAQKYVFDLATNVPKSEYEAIVAVGGNGPLVEKLNTNGIRTVLIPQLNRDVHPLKDISSFFALLKILKKERPTIVHLNSSKIGGLGALAGRIARIPLIIFTAHGWAFFEDRGKAQNKAIKFLSWITSFLCHKVITVSKKDYDAGMLMPFVKEKMLMIYNGIRTPQYLPREDARRLLAKNHPELLENGSRLWIGTIAELHNNKGHIYQIEAIEGLKAKGLFEKESPLFMWIGEGEERQTIKSVIDSKNLDTSIKLVGALPEASRFLKAFDIFVLSSKKEGLPYAVIEAGFAQLPIISTNVGGISEIIENGKEGILVPPKNTKAITEALTTYCSNKNIRETHSIAIHEKVTREFTLESMIEKTIEIYKN